MGKNQKLKWRLKQAGKAVRSIPSTVKDPSVLVTTLQTKVMEKAQELAEVSKKGIGSFCVASDGTKLGMIRAIQKRFPDAKPKCPNCTYHSTGYDDFIDHMRGVHGASI